MKKEEFAIPVYSTEDYSIFEKLPGNRELYPNHVKRLVEVIEKTPDFTRTNPIRVNKEMKIIDGQHRLAAYREYASGKNKFPPLYYLIESEGTLASARQLNVGQKPWLPIDYAMAYSEDGNKNYTIYIKLSKKYRVTHDVLSSVLSGSRASRTSSFRNGLFTVNNVVEAEEKIKMLLDCSVYYHNWPNQSFGMAMLRIMESPLYNQERMLEQLSKYKEALYNVPQRKIELMHGINMVYNWKNTDKVDLLKS